MCLDGRNGSEIKERIGSLRAKFGNLTQSYTGKLVRLLATTGIGLIPPPVGLVAGALAGFLDTFLIERVLPKSGVVAFLSSLYPSIFDENGEKRQR